ncbi:uncharacterized protein N7503_001399 [Penicillium pulvis]|uniref:uncharacterized protein n=1 Tax=Penicillium pulvis TaxID=1562058 RepID=UPI002549044F|nr:uncharacterized protein N7503_001399 [Penicillium pulvis]KAJ5809181.1 hypothetical protein N7503_001399 [Penicillium pulvis]
MTTNISMTGANSGMQVALNSGQMNQYFSPPERAHTPPEPLSTVPFSRNPDFVDPPDARLALVGMGGVGKSQLVIEYCYRTRVTSPETWVFWVHASNAARFEQDYRKIAEQAKITRVGNLVLDNLDDNRFLYEPQYLEGGQGGAKMPPIEYLPHSANGCIMITTRDRRVALDFVTDSCIVQIDPMTQPDAVSLLEIMLGEQGKEPNRTDVLKLAETLEYMPLAIEQAAAYIRRQFPLYSIQQYLRDFGRNDGERLKLLAHEAGRHYRDWEAKNSILVTWQLSFDQIRAENPSAADLLSLMSFFDRQAIPESLLHIQSTEHDKFSMDDSPISTSNKDETCFEVRTPIRGRVRQALHDHFNWLRPSFWTAGARSQDHQNPEPAEVGTLLEDTILEHTIKSRENTLRDDILILRDYSLLSITPDHTLFEMHRIVQLATRKWLEAHGQTEKWLKTFIRRLANAIPKEVDEQSRVVCLSLFPHIESALMHRTSSNEVMIDRGSLLFETTVHLTAVVSPRAMLAISLASMEAFEQCLGTENYMTIYSAMYTGIAYLQLARYPDAEAIFEKVIEVEERLGRIDDYCSHTAMNNLICVY